MNKNDIEHFKDEYGLVHPSPYRAGEPSQNGLRFLSEWAIVCHQHYGFNVADFDAFYFAVRKCRAGTGVGLLARHPVLMREQYIAQDDYTPVITAAYVIGDHQLLTDIYKKGTNSFPRYTYNNVNPGKFYYKSYFGRYFQFRAHIKWALDKKPNFAEQLVWGYCTMISPKKGDQDSWALSKHLLIVGEHRNKWTRFCGRVWRWRFKRCFGNATTMEPALAGYYSEGHPIPKNWKI